MKTWRLMAEYDAETTTYSACAGAAQTSPYTPDFNGTLVGLRVVLFRGAVTQLVNHVQFRLTSVTFSPNVMHVGGNGSGLQTAPAVQPPSMDWQVGQPVKAGVPITIEARNVTADTPVAVQMGLYGLFQS